MQGEKRQDQRVYCQLEGNESRSSLAEKESPETSRGQCLWGCTYSERVALRIVAEQPHAGCLQEEGEGA